MVSQMTLYCRRVEFGMLDDPYSIISEEKLLSTVCQIAREHPQVGQSFILGRLRSLGYSVNVFSFIDNNRPSLKILHEKEAWYVANI